MTVENALSKSYKKIIKFQLEPVWHQVKFIFNLNFIYLQVFFFSLVERKDEAVGERFGDFAQRFDVAYALRLRNVP